MLCLRISNLRASVFDLRYFLNVSTLNLFLIFFALNIDRLFHFPLIILLSYKLYCMWLCTLNRYTFNLLLRDYEIMDNLYHMLVKFETLLKTQIFSPWRIFNSFLVEKEKSLFRSLRHIWVNQYRLNQSHIISKLEISILLCDLEKIREKP